MNFVARKPPIFSKYAAVVLFFLVGTFSVLLSIYRPFNNWDMIGYIAAAKSFEEDDISRIHSFTYDHLKQSVSVDEYEALTSGYYRGAVGSDPAVLGEQLPFYQIRPVYTGLIFLLYKAGMNIAFATHAISAASVVVALFLIWSISLEKVGATLTSAIPLFAVLYGVYDLARLSTPDGLAFLSLISAAFLFLKGRLKALFLLMPLIIGVRTDLILFVAPFALLLIIYNNTVRIYAFTSLAASLAAYLAINAFWKNPGWSTIFYFTLVEIQTHPITTSLKLHFYHYLHALWNGVKGLYVNKSFIAYGIVSWLSFWAFFDRSGFDSNFSCRSSYCILAAVCFLFLCGHFIAFPVMWDRFFTGPYLIATLALFMAVRDRSKLCFDSFAEGSTR